MENGKPIEGSLYVYAPNKGAPIFFAVVFAASAFGHLWQCYRFKCFKLMGLHPLCAALFAVGYALREYGAFNYLYNTQNLIIYILSVCLIYICPPLLELANYHVLGRIFYYVPYFAPLDPGKVMSTFGALSVLVETLNSTGVSLRSNTRAPQGTQVLGSRLTTAALVIQLIAIAVFVLLAAIFHRRCAKANIHVKALSAPLTTMYISMSLILVRCIYRMVEQFGNTTVRLDDPSALIALSPTLRYEWFFYVFEATLMLVNSVLWNVRNPRRHLPKNNHVYLAEDGRTELEGEDKTDGRPLLATVIDPFGIVLRKKKVSRPFGELNSYPDANRRVESGLPVLSQST